jgi:hypothetical protein
MGWNEHHSCREIESNELASLLMCLLLNQFVRRDLLIIMACVRPLISKSPCNSKCPITALLLSGGRYA